MQQITRKLLLLLCVLLVTGCTPAPTNLQQIVDPDLNKTNKIIFTNTAVNQQIATEDELKIKEFTSYINDFVLQESGAQHVESPPLWEAEFYKEGQLAALIKFQSPLYIDGTYYELIEPELNMDAIERFITTLPQ